MIWGISGAIVPHPSYHIMAVLEVRRIVVYVIIIGIIKMKENKKITWTHGLELGFAKIGDGIVTILTLGRWNAELEMGVAVKIGKQRAKDKEKYRRN